MLDGGWELAEMVVVQTKPLNANEMIKLDRNADERVVADINHLKYRLNTVTFALECR
jgi:hypothetical protein